MTNRQLKYDSLKLEMEDVGFIFEREQWPHHQNRREMELKFIHPQLIQKWEEEGYSVMAKKFYIKPLSEELDCEIGFVTGKSSPLKNEQIFSSPNFNDPHDDNPAWINRKDDRALDSLLKSIRVFLGEL